MIDYRSSGDILAESSEALVNTVNCDGFMGKGVALQFKKAFPDNFKAYANACERGEVRPGRMFVYETQNLLGPRYIINFPTKRHWRGKSRMEDIESGLEALVREISERNIHSIATPCTRQRSGRPQLVGRAPAYREGTQGYLHAPLHNI